MKNERVAPPTRLSKEELRRSRMGLLGCFPDTTRFDPEAELEQKAESSHDVGKRGAKRHAGARR
jgi:hypothetical protein